MSQSVIGALRVNLGLDSARFQKGAKQAQSQLRAMQGQFKAFAATATVVAAGLGVMTTATVRAARQIDTLSKLAGSTPEQFQRWAAGAKTVGIEQEKLADILKDTQDRVGDFNATGGGPMADFFENIAPLVDVTADSFKNLTGADALQLYVSSLEKAGVSQQEMTFYMEAMASDASALVPLLQNGGAAMDAMGEKAASLGAVMSGETLKSMTQADLALQDIGLAMTGVRYQIVSALAPSLTILSQKFVTAMQDGGVLRDVISGIGSSLHEIAGVGAAAMAAFAARYAFNLAVSLGATNAFTGALLVMKRALITTGIGAVIVGAGILAGKFFELTAATGSFSGAIALLKDVALEVSGRIVTYFEGVTERVGGFVTGLRADFTRGMGGVVEAVLNAANRAIGAWVGAHKAIIAAWSTTPAVFKRLGAQAMNGLIDVISDGMQGVLAPVNALREAVGKDPIVFSALDRFKQDVGETVDVLGAVKGAFYEAFNADYVNQSGITQAFEAQADALDRSAASADRQGRAMQGLATRPLQSWGVLTDTLKEGADVLDGGAAAAEDYSRALNNLGGGVGQAGKDGGSAGRAAKATKELADEIERLEFEADPVKKYNAEIAHLNKLLDAGLSQGAYDKEVAKLNDELADQLPLMGDISDAWGDFIGRGFRDFKGFANDILDSFKNLITQMIVTAARNRIVIGLGLST
ncbi:MAG TPA: hypothetical protein DCS45_13870, partial [Roseovarius nubinhibens]|nr:hypothetical protein [Roseovarius nubinhibens]